LGLAIGERAGAAAFSEIMARNELDAGLNIHIRLQLTGGELEPYALAS
jgi:hypothetical protein